MIVLLDIMDVLIAAWPVCACLALFLLGWRQARRLRLSSDLHRYATYEATERANWKTIGFDAWLDVWEREQAGER